MTEPLVSHDTARAEDNDVSLLFIGSVLLRWRRTIIGLGVVGAALGLAKGLTTTRVYKSAATFIPQGSEGAASGLALAARTFGISVPSSGGTWVPQVYVELLRSPDLLGPLALDTVEVAEEGRRRAALMDLLKVRDRAPEMRMELAVRALQAIVSASVDRDMGAVTLSVVTPWPSVSLALVQRLVSGVNQFNLETRKSQAAEERRFVAVQAADAERALREAEDQLQTFLQRNRVVNSPQLTFARDRLQREVALRQQVYTALVQGLEDAKIREVRDTPVITVLEAPRLPVVGEARHSVMKGLFGGFAGAMVGALVAFLVQAVAGARRTPSDEAREFFALVSEVTPRFLRKGGR